MNHIPGRKHTCPECSSFVSGVRRKCMFFNADRSPTKYALSCGYVQKKRAKTLFMQHGVLHVKGWNVLGAHVWESFDTLKEARRYLAQK